ncbi:MAG: NIPSNAP family protein, partial [Roseibacillus sp.]|nr:NIPSNAP family protein [Roseibacillus sp.]
MMKLASVPAALALLLVTSVPAAEVDGRVFELRTYYANEGKLDALHARFRDHTCDLFEKHGMQNVGYWVPVNNESNVLIYIVSHESRQGAQQ